MAIKRDERQIGVQPSNRLIREFRTDLPSPSGEAVQRFAQTIGEIGEQGMRSDAKKAATETAFGTELGKDENGNFIKPAAPENFGIFARDTFDEIINQRMVSTSAADFERQALGIRTQYADRPQEGAAVLEAAAQARLRTMDPAMRGRLEPVFRREVNQHVGPMLMEDARKRERMAIAGINDDITNASNKASDLFSVGTPEAKEQGEGELNTIRARVDELIRRGVLPETRRAELEKNFNAVRAGGAILGVIKRRLDEGNISENDFIDLERVIRFPYADENVLGIKSADIRAAMATPESRAAFAARVRELGSLMTRRLTQQKQEANYQNTVKLAQSGRGGFPVNMSEPEKTAVIERWSRENGLTDANGNVAYTPENIDRIFRTFRELPKQAIRDMFSSANTLKPEELEARRSVFTYLRNMPVGQGDNVVAIGLLAQNDFNFYTHYDQARKSGGSPERAAESANNLVKRGEVAVTTYRGMIDFIVPRYKTWTGVNQTEKSLLDLMDNKFPSTGINPFGGGRWSDASHEHRMTILTGVYQAMANNETLSVPEAMTYAVSRFMETHSYSPDLANQNGGVGRIVPNSDRLPEIADVKQQSNSATTSAYVPVVVNLLLSADKNRQASPYSLPENLRLIPRSQPGFNLPDYDKLKYGKNIALQPVGGSAANPGFQLVYKDEATNGWLSLSDYEGNKIVLHFDRVAKQQDTFARELITDYERSQAVFEKSGQDMRGEFGPLPGDPAAPDSPRWGDRPFAPFDTRDLFVERPGMNQRGGPTMNPVSPGIRGLRDDGAPSVLEPSDVPASGASESAYTPGDEPASMMPPVRPPQSELDGARSRRSTTEAPSSSHARMREFVVRGKRETIVDGLDKTFAERLERMVDAMPPEIRRGFQIGSAYRSVEEQRVLYNRAVAKYGSERIARRWAAPPGRSYHNHGKAVDLRFGSQEVRDWVHSNARRFQMYFPMGHEPWHMEPLGTRGTKDRVAFNFDGDTEDNTA